MTNMDTEQKLLEFLSRYSEMDEGTLKKVVDAIPVRTFKKGDILLRQGEEPTHCIFVIAGCLRQYRIDEDGNEVTSEFYTEEQWINVFNNNIKDKLSKYTLSCLEDSGDCHLRSGKPFLARVFAGSITPRSKILGSTISGKIKSLGTHVTKFKVGDEIFASLGMNSGSHAEYILLSDSDAIAIKPDSVSHEEAVSLVFGPLNAKYFLEKTGIAKGKSVLIIGVAGGVGSYAVQLAKSYGAHVTGACSTKTIDFVKSLGADEIIDYKKTDMTKQTNQYDVILDMVSKKPVSKLKAMLTDNGAYITTVANFSVILSGLFNPKVGKKIIFDLSKSDSSDLEFIRDLTLKGEFKPLISQVYDLKDIQEAHRHVKTSTKNGSVVVRIRKS